MSTVLIAQTSSQQNLGVKRTNDSKIKAQNESDPEISNLKERLSENMAHRKSGPKEEQTIRKCLRKGSRICYTDMENITVLRKIPEKKGSEKSLESNPKEGIFEKIDSYRSGESIFKTFTFEQTRDIDDPETVKCIEFWKSVMKKNLAPIKCTLLDDSKKTREQKPKTSLPKKKSQERRTSEEKPDKLNLTADAAKIWSDALKEIRNRKLDQLKLYVRDRCKYCTDPFTKDMSEKHGTETVEDQRSVIISLNDWEPTIKQIDLMESLGGAKRRFSVKSKKSSQTTETRINEKSFAEQAQKDHSKNEVTIQTETNVTPVEKGSSCVKADPSKKRASILKRTSKSNQQRESTISVTSKKSTAPKTSTAGVQAPTIKCPCESDTCLCPHRAAARNSRSTFIEIVREKLLHRDESVELYFPKPGEPCICERLKPDIWQKFTCVSQLCVAKQPKVAVQESCSNLNLQDVLQTSDDTCVCAKNIEIICPNELCPHATSQGSLIEGRPEVKADQNDSCICSTSDTEVPCNSDVCPSKTPKEISTTCICASSAAWSQPICKSWDCRHHKKKIKPDDETITFRGHKPIKETTTTCMCKDETIPVWQEVTCSCEVCEKKVKPDSLTKVRKGSVLKTGTKSRKTSKETLAAKQRERTGSITSLDRQRTRKANKQKSCVCFASPPWKTVTCFKHCTEESAVKPEHVVDPTNGECVCQDVGIEPICKAYECKNKAIHVNYPPPCICPKDVEETKLDFKCLSETCKMKKIDKTCLCRLDQDAICDTKTCISKPQPSETMTKSEQPLKYDTKCICRVRGLPTTLDVSCTAPACPFQKKYPKIVKKKAPKLFVRAPEEYKDRTDENECICTDTAAKCRSKTCKMKIAKSEHTTEDSEKKACICKDPGTEIDTDQEIICNTIQCPKTTVAKDGAIMNDKCVCANLDQTCFQPNCPSADNELQNKVCSEILQIKRQPYCYICGHYDCVNTRKKKEICEFSNEE